MNRQQISGKASMRIFTDIILTHTSSFLLKLCIQNVVNAFLHMYLPMEKKKNKNHLFNVAILTNIKQVVLKETRKKKTCTPHSSLYIIIIINVFSHLSVWVSTSVSCVTITLHVNHRTKGQQA